jgi:hypothetical protein
MNFLFFQVFVVFAKNLAFLRCDSQNCLLVGFLKLYLLKIFVELFDQFGFAWEAFTFSQDHWRSRNYWLHILMLLYKKLSFFYALSAIFSAFHFNSHIILKFLS